MNRDSFQYAPSLVLAGALLLGLYFLLMLIVELRIVLSVVFLGVVLGVALAPLADYFNRFHVPRPVSVIGVYALVAGAITLFLWYAIPELASEGQTLIEESNSWQERYSEIAEDGPLPSLERVQETLEDLAAGMGASLAGRAMLVLDIGLYFVSVLVIAVFFTISRERMMGLTLTLVAREHRLRTREVLHTIAARLRRYMLAQFISMVFVGVLTYLGLLALGVPFALILGTLAFFLSVLPIIGATIAFGAAFLVALTEGLTVALLVAGFYLAIEAIESYILIPLVQKSQTEMPELLVLIAILIGGALMGLMGAIIALPVAVVVYIVAVEVVIPWRQAQVTHGGNTPEQAPAARADARTE